MIKIDFNMSNTYIIKFTIYYKDNYFIGGICISDLTLDKLESLQKEFLHPKERDYFNTLQYVNRQHSYLLGRYCAKKALIVCTSIHQPHDIVIERGVLEQPVVCHASLNNMQVSITHNKILGAAVAFPEICPMGIDIEIVEEDKNTIIFNQLTIYEQNILQSLFESIPLQLFWTMKEALSKVIRCGLTIPFELLEIENIKQEDIMYKGFFKNFPQYQVISFVLKENVCSLVYPKNTYIDLNINSIREIF